MTARIVASYSEIDTWRQCPLKHRLSYVERWSKPPRDGGPLAKGILWHLVMQAHHETLRAETHPQGRNGLTRGEIRFNERIILKVCREAVDPLLYNQQTGEQTEDQTLIEWMYEGYIQRYGADPEWEILAVEVREIVPLYHASGRKSRFDLKTKIDLVVRDRSTGEIILVDHKSGQNLPSQLELDIDDQFGLYEIAWNRARLHQHLKQVSYTIHNAARTQRNKSPMALDARFDRSPMNRTGIELRNIELDALRVLQQAYSAANLDQPSSSPDPRQCGWKCDFLDPHLLARKGEPIRPVLVDYGFAVHKERH